MTLLRSVEQYDVHVEPLVVTGFWRVQSSKHSFQDYAAWFTNFAQIPTKPLVFCALEDREFLERTWVEVSGRAPRFELWNFWQFHSHTLGVNWSLQEQLDPEIQTHKGKDLYLIWNERPFLMLRATMLFPNATHFLWLDIGIFRDWDTLYKFDLHYFATCPQDKVMMLNVNAFNEEDLQVFMGLPKKDFADRSSPEPDRIAGGEFWGCASAIRRLAHAYFELLEKLAADGRFVGKDQIVYNSLFVIQPELLHLLPSDGRGDPWFTFARLFFNRDKRARYDGCNSNVE